MSKAINKTTKIDFSNVWVIGMGVGILACLAGIAYALFMTELAAGTLMAMFGGPGVLVVALLAYRGQRRRVEYTERGVAEINSALVKIAEGDLTVRVPEDNTVTRDIAREINASTQRQRELIRNIKTPFKVSSEGITKIGVIAEGQVEKGRELTRSVVESTTAATEMVRTSEEIKKSTAEAAKTSERNRQRVAQGYELTKDMSKASVDVR
jgi:methyl-accepting chemotaxis protein